MKIICCFLLILVIIVLTVILTVKLAETIPKKHLNKDFSRDRDGYGRAHRLVGFVALPNTNNPSTNIRDMDGRPYAFKMCLDHKVFGVMLHSRPTLALMNRADNARTPLVTLNDGYTMPTLALGTWLGNSTTRCPCTFDQCTCAGRIKPGSAAVERAVSWAIDAGYRHVDTAYAYRVEDQVGRAVAKKIGEGVRRDELFITTKLWNDAHARTAVVPALRGQLATLGLTYVDLYLIHWPIGQFDNGTYDTTDYLETWRGMIEAKRLGLTRSIGLSNFNQEMMDRIRANYLETPAVLQVELNLNLQQPELLAYCRTRNITVMGYTPFGSLFPSKATPSSPPPRVDDPALVAIAQKYNKTVPQVVLRYLIELGVVPIPKSLNKSRIEQNIEIFDFALSESDKVLLKSYDRGYRAIPQYKWLDHPYYPFEKLNRTVEASFSKYTLSL